MVTKIIVGHMRVTSRSTYLEHNLTLSWTNGALKSAFQISMATDLDFSNSDSATTLSGPNRMTMPNFVEVG